MALTLGYLEFRFQKHKKKNPSNGTTTSNEQDDALALDNPIQTQEEDLLNRDGFVDDFVKTIATFPHTDAYVFGLLAAWGDGKSSVINLITEKLDTGTNPPLIIQFDPWYFNTQDKTLQSFFDTIYKAFNEDAMYPALLRNFGRYKSLLSSAAKEASFNIDIFAAVDDSLYAQKDEINRLLKKLKRRVIVFVDDIDRLDKEEMKFVFKLIRLCSDFSYFIYVLSYDKELVSKTLRDEFDSDNRYLDKIVQTEIQLPKIQRTLLDAIFGLFFDKLFKRLEISLSTLEMNRLRDRYNVDIKYCFKNIREIKRYFNSLTINLARVKGEVDIIDFIILEIVREKHPGAYNYIYENAELFHYGNGMRILSLRHVNVSSEERAEALENALGVDTNSPADKENLKRLVVELFPALDSTGFGGSGRPRRNGQYIADPDYFSKYFSFMIEKSDISDVYVKQFLQSFDESDQEEWNSAFEVEIKKHQEANKFNLFMEKLKPHILEENPATKEKFVKAIYRLGGIFRLNSADLAWSEETEAALIIFDVLNSLELPNAKWLLIEAITECPDDRFASYLIYNTKPDQNILKHSIEDADLQQKYDERMTTRYVTPQKDIFVECPEDFVPVLRQWSQSPRIDYLEGIFAQTPEHVCAFLVKFVKTRSEREPREFDYEDLVSIAPLDLIKNALEHIGDDLPDDTIKFAVDMFNIKYQEAQNSRSD